jgi:hypothetical protein
VVALGVVVAALGLLWVQRDRQEISARRLVAAMSLREGDASKLVDRLAMSREPAPVPGREARAALAGVRTVDLELAIQAGDGAGGRAAIADLIHLARHEGDQDLAVDLLRALWVLQDAEAEQAAEEVRTAERRLAGSFGENRYYLGEWAEAVQVAGALGRPEFFKAPVFRRPLVRFLRGYAGASLGPCFTEIEAAAGGALDGPALRRLEEVSGRLIMAVTADQAPCPPVDAPGPSRSG